MIFIDGNNFESALQNLYGWDSQGSLTELLSEQPSNEFMGKWVLEAMQQYPRQYLANWQRKLRFVNR
jgi:hypothetical protein